MPKREPAALTPQRRATSRWSNVAGVGLLVVIASVVAYLKLGPDRESVTLAMPTESTPSADEKLSGQAIGVWTDSYQGKRTLTIREDGTATMVVELSGYKARLFTPRLELDIKWSVKNGKMHRRTVGGRPASKVAFVNRRAGVAVAEPIIELSENRMVLEDQDGSQKYTWRRAK